MHTCIHTYVHACIYTYIGECQDGVDSGGRDRGRAKPDRQYGGTKQQYANNAEGENV
jgi:hypothetical protein